MSGLAILTPARVQRFWAKVDLNGPIPLYRPTLGQCWIWGGHVHNGYGEWHYAADEHIPAHQVGWMLLHGEPFPDGMDTDHLCLTPSCVRPSHLEAVTRAENIRRSHHTGQRPRKTRCKQGHALTPDNTYVDPRGWRQCRVCLNATYRRYRTRRRERAA